MKVHHLQLMKLIQYLHIIKKKSRILNLFNNQIISSPIEIELESLDNYIKNKNINFVDILKIDTEGYEYEIF